MKILAWGAVLVGSMVAVAACGSSTDGNNGGGGTGGATSSSSSSSSGTASSSSSSSSGSTSSSSSSGGTGGAAACGIYWDTDPARAACETCMEDACCAELLDCAPGTECDKFLACAQPCTTSACFTTCTTQFATGYEAYNVVQDCYDGSCKQDSGCSWPVCDSGLAYYDPFSECASCLGTSCCAQVTACMADAGCATCYTTADPTMLPANCTAAGDPVATLYAATQTCQTASCEKPCTSGICDSGLTVGVPACDYCLGSSCCTEISECWADSTCQGCLTSGGANAGCNTNTLYTAINTCWSTSCSTDCG